MSRLLCCLCPSRNEDGPRQSEGSQGIELAPRPAKLPTPPAPTDFTAPTEAPSLPPQSTSPSPPAEPTSPKQPALVQKQDDYAAGDPENNGNGSGSDSSQQLVEELEAITTTAPARSNLWDDAVERLTEDEKRWLKQVEGEPLTAPKTSAVDEMIRLVTEKQHQCEEKAWKTIKIGNHEFSFRDVAKRSIVWLNKFKEIGDTIVQYDPVHAALPWAAARFILQITIAYGEQMASSLVIIERTTRIVHRCQVFERLYTTDTLPLEVAQSFQSALIELYTLLLQGLMRVAKFLSKNTMTRSFITVLLPTEISGLLSDLDDCEVEVKKEVSVCEAQSRFTTDKEMLRRLDGLLSLEKPLLRVDENVAEVLSHITTQELIKILEWISEVKYTLHHQTFSQGRTSDTCGWIIRRTEFYEWQSTTSSTMLWLQGLQGDIRQHLIHLPKIEILAKDNEDDIAKFVAESIERNGNWSYTLKRDQTLKNEIVNTLLSKSGGMFQWAKLQISQLLKLRHEKDLRDKLGKLPKDLESAYDEIYQNIESLPNHGKNQAFRALKWVMCAYQPLTIEALLTAIRVDPDEEIMDESSDTTEEDLLDWCANLLGIDSQHDPPVWRPSHLSVVEYLESHFTSASAHGFVATASLVLLHETYHAQKSEQIRIEMKSRKSIQAWRGF
ncbi:hypothetical protein G7Z17_g4483 [Cylindrodendrum hubeiense]|uniref:NWD NACHT-NTPase N-terminal domain-containing protein n=1 Tax=Cylindrodendrum hubeiense TaxID=595255 RepID=A0A9P5HJ21_9HYPO|nr:hypothetical protein G7Z17_g4483 [Cylindrodendrum hubeiense]